MSNNSTRNARKKKPGHFKQRSNKTSNGRGRQPRQARKPSDLNPDLLVRKASNTVAKEYRSEILIEDLPIASKLKKCLGVKGYIRPTEIQAKSIESLLEGRDILGIAQTGTGKTGAFLIPIIDRMLRIPTKPFALVVVPTRELALQVESEFKSMTKGMGLYSTCFIGGTNINRDLQNLRRVSHVIIATPGRLLDLVNRRMIDLRQIHTLVLDEFDRMLDMGFVNDVKRILRGMQNRKHTMLFSATLDKKQQGLIDDILNNPVVVKVSSGTTSSENVEQDVVRISQGEDKFLVLCDMLEEENFEKVLVFEETKHRVSRLCKKLNGAGILSDQIHGNKSQNARQRALNSFKEGSIRVLVATDVAARGIDVSDVTHVINYQIPMSYDSYIHRIGRTGRAGKTGMAFTFVEG